MTSRSRDARACAAIVLSLSVALVVAGSVHAWATSSRDANAEAAAQLVQRMRDAPTRQDFAGTATIVWRAGSSLRRAEVQVHDSGGSLEVSSGDEAAFDDGRHTYLRDELGWTSVLIPNAETLPAPGHHWALSTETGPLVAGRPTAQVVVTRQNGSVAQRLLIDRDSGLLVSREVLDPRGQLQRSVVFTTLEVGDVGATVKVPTNAHEARVEALAAVPDGYRAPASPGGGYRLVTRARQGDGILLFYSDGIFTASVLEQQGTLDWHALPGGGTSETVAGRRVRHYTDPSGDVLVWQGDGLVYTVVSDAPTDVTDRMVDGLEAPARSVPEGIADFVLGPFGWR
jgi:hypothetical protein